MSFAFVFLCALFCHADQDAQTVRSAHEEKRRAVVELLELTGARSQAVRMMDTMTALLPPDVRDGLRQAVDVDEMIRRIIPVYEQHLSLEEINALINFYSTPDGTRILKAQPDLIHDSMIVMKVYMQDQLRRQAGMKVEGE